MIFQHKVGQSSKFIPSSLSLVGNPKPPLNSSPMFKSFQMVHSKCHHSCRSRRLCWPAPESFCFLLSNQQENKHSLHQFRVHAWDIHCNFLAQTLLTKENSLSFMGYCCCHLRSFQSTYSPFQRHKTWCYHYHIDKTHEVGCLYFLVPLVSAATCRSVSSSICSYLCRSIVLLAFY